MSKDEGRFSSFVLYELYFPSLLQKTIIRAVARLDHAYFGEFLGRRVRAWEDKHYARMRKVHAMGLTMHEEDDLVFYFSCASGFWITKMPYMGDLDFYYVDQWPEHRRRRLMRFYKECVKRELYLNGTDKIHLSKNPIFAGRIEALIETFPDARIVVLMRDPRETIPSLLKLVNGGWKRLKWDPERVQRCLGVLAEQSFHTYHYPLEVLSRHTGVLHAIVDYRDLTGDPASAVAKVYAALNLPMDKTYRDWLATQGDKERSHVSGHTYSLTEFGLNEDEIRTRLADVFERFGWEALETHSDGESAERSGGPR
jgi:hypothetical protein